MIEECKRYCPVDHEKIQFYITRVAATLVSDQNITIKLYDTFCDLIFNGMNMIGKKAYITENYLETVTAVTMRCLYSELFNHLRD